MALMNRVGAVFYNLGLILTLTLVFLCLKNYNLDSPELTGEYSQSLMSAIYLVVGFYAVLSLVLVLVTGISRARKKGLLYWGLVFLLFMALGGIALFLFGESILEDPIDTPGYVFLAVPVFAIIGFSIMIALALMQMPGSIEKERLVKAIKKELKQEIEESQPFCPACKYRVKNDWKCCPSCGSRFSD